MKMLSPVGKSLIVRSSTLVLVLVLVLSSLGCASVQPWEKDTLALGPMAVEGSPCQAFEHNNEVYREGSVGANGGKSGGGCGCS
ncbi:MAG: DUF4266 domain-containing protein [Deltaproteobacteria bacterium]|nr:DUF4266 domain-containing protein [Deltaproteobacteria bacterium]